MKNINENLAKMPIKNRKYVKNCNSSFCCNLSSVFYSSALAFLPPAVTPGGAG